MNQAPSPRLRPRSLLLLVPLLLAMTPPSLSFSSALVLATAGVPDHVAFVNFPPKLSVNECIPLGVELHDINKQPAKAGMPIEVTLGANLEGSFYTQGCVTPAPSVIIPVDTTGQTVWYRSLLPGNLVLTATARQYSLGDALPLLLTVTPLPPTHFEVIGIPERLGQQIVFNVTVTARYDSGEIATEYTGTIHFTTRTQDVTPPPDATFISADKGAKQFTVTFPAGGPFDLTVADTLNGRISGSMQSTVTVTGPATRFDMDVPENVTAGDPIDFTVLPLDAAGNPTTFQGLVHFETQVLEKELPPDTPPDGRLPPQFRVKFLSASPDALEFTVTGKEYLTGRTVSGTTKVTVHPGKPTHVELTAPPANPVPACGKVGLTLTPKDEWGNIVRDMPLGGVTVCKAPLSSATFEGTSLKNPSYEGDCVTGTLEGSAQVFWRDENGEAVDFAVTSPGTNAPVRVAWQPCPSAFLRLQLLPPADDQDVQPGSTVELEAKVSYTGEEPINNGMLMMLGDGLTVLSVSLDGGDLSARGDGFVVPKVQKDASLTAKITALTSLESKKTLTMKVWFASAEGVELTPKQSVTFDSGKSGVDVGCGCHAGALPGQLFPWLALLLAASRPWERLRRLRRGERTDH